MRFCIPVIYSIYSLKAAGPFQELRGTCLGIEVNLSEKKNWKCSGVQYIISNGAILIINSSNYNQS